ncbi:MAG: hypothetical protein ABSF24_06700 [Candidatus Bathyarchaeia archaeon]
MPRRNAQTAETQVVTEPSRLDLLEAFAELVAERWGYFMGRRLTQQEMTEKCKNEIKAAREKSKALNGSIEKLIKGEDPEVRAMIETQRADLKNAKEIAGEARKPFQQKIAPLAQAQKYCDNVAIPDSLKELGHPVTPRFSLSEWVGKAVEQNKRKKK